MGQKRIHPDKKNGLITISPQTFLRPLAVECVATSLRL